MEKLLLLEYPNHNQRNIKAAICTHGQSHRAPAKSQYELQIHCFDKEKIYSYRKLLYGNYILRQLMYKRGVCDAFRHKSIIFN